MAGVVRPCTGRRHRTGGNCSGAQSLAAGNIPPLYSEWNDGIPAVSIGFRFIAARRTHGLAPDSANRPPLPIVRQTGCVRMLPPPAEKSISCPLNGGAFLPHQDGTISPPGIHLLV